MTDPTQVSEDLAEIRRAIEAARRDRATYGDIYVVWGLIVVLGTIIEIVANHLEAERPWLGWIVLAMIGGVWSGITSSRRERAARVLTHAARVEAQSWLACSIGLFVITFIGGISGRVSSHLITPLISVSLGVPVRTAGALYDNRHLRWASLGFFACGGITLFLPRTTGQFLFAAMMLVGYVWPGIAMIRAERRKVG